MITINLLPEELRTKESSLANFKIDFKGKGEFIRKIAISAAIILLAAHGTLFLIGARNSAVSNGLTKRYNRLLPERKDYESLKAEVDVTKGKAKAIEVLMANRFSWSGKLTDLSDSVPPGIWLTDLSYDETPIQVTAQVPMVSARPGGGKELMKTETKQMIRRYMNISGYATSMGEQGTALVGKFISRMKDSPAFFSDFSEIKLESIKSERVLEQEVMNFKITCLFRN